MSKNTGTMINLLSCNGDETDKRRTVCQAELVLEDDILLLDNVEIEFNGIEVYKAIDAYDSYCSKVGYLAGKCSSSDKMVDSIWFKSPYIKWPALKTQDEFDEHATKMVKFWLGHNAHERFGYKINYLSGWIEVFKPINLFKHNLAWLTKNDAHLFYVNFFTGEFKDFHGYAFKISEEVMQEMINPILREMCQCRKFPVK